MVGVVVIFDFDKMIIECDSDTWRSANGPGFVTTILQSLKLHELSHIHNCRVPCLVHEWSRICDHFVPCLEEFSTMGTDLQQLNADQGRGPRMERWGGARARTGCF
ncbi:hypothetical protein HHK36_002955 [Tetracentron sinense]|uniref:Uncharacterized protein n=1 Tax=Tetracentron sinense TaxID=13715 RepID=A0A834ZNE0_TETSI|nr:hypothetical protein HHK36_002955 [Tetracentron sinense]